MNKQKFSAQVKARVFRDNIQYIDAILAVCEDNDMYPEDTNGFLSDIIKEKLEAEAVEMRFIKGGNQLPV